ncbi:MAG: type 1 glutamine amidotransferase domain-containing protein [Vulcanimicrobiota bacterium]
MKVAMILTNQFEDSEAGQPLKCLRENDFEVDVVAPTAGEAYRGKKGSCQLKSDKAIADTDPSDYDALVIPGGSSPEQLRLEKGAVEFVGHFVKQNKPIAAICHGPQLLISADGVRGKKATCYASVAVDLKNAGARFEDKSVVVDDNLVTSRKPEDIPDFNREMIKLFSQQPAKR